jgi:cysteine synthase
MARIDANRTELIGRAPLVRLNKVAAGLPATVVAKQESQNPLSSVRGSIGLARRLILEESLYCASKKAVIFSAITY